jgi:AraC-like DNA-binding protein/PAS domain-containing protein
MEYLTAAEAAQKWGIEVRQVQNLCIQGRVPGAKRFNRSWAIPAETGKPVDSRSKKRREAVSGDDGILQFAPDKNEYLAKVVEHFPYSIAIFRPDGTLTYANDAYLKAFFVNDRMQVLGKLNLLQDEITRNSGMVELAEKALKGETFFLEERKIPLKEVASALGNGLPPPGIFYKSLVTFPIHDDTGRLAYMVTLFLPTREYQGKDEFVRGMEYIENHWNENFDLNAAAEASRLSRAQFTKTFKEFSGITPYEYYQQIKIKQIKMKLLDCNLSVSQAFAACGIDYSGHYAKLFQRHVGMTPVKYRKNHG